MPSIPCCIDNCYKSSQTRHRFPNPSKNIRLFNKWVNLAGNWRLKSMTPEKIYSSCRICSLHFVPQDFGPNNSLKKGAFPSVNLKDSLEPVEDEAETASRGPKSTDESPRTKKVKMMLEKLRAKKEDYVIPSSSKTVIEYPSEAGVPEEINNTTVGISEPSCSSAQLYETPKKRSALLSEISVSNVKELTPKAKHLYHRAVLFKRRAALSTKSKLSFKRRLLTAKKFTKSNIFQKCVSSMDRIKARFFECQIENVNRKAKGRRYTLEDKVLALALYKQSGTGYRFLSKLFALPSRKTVMKLLNRIPIHPGLHDALFTILKAEVKNFKNALDKHCVLIFDEMSIQPNLQPNFSEGRVAGFEDFGYRQTQEIANHVQVFMLRGIKRKWKQPIYYNFVNGATKKDDIVYILKLIARKCQNIGLNIVATICDQGANNQAAINKLVRETREKYLRLGSEFDEFHFEIDDHKIIPLFDVPHLFKGLRNNLLKYNLKFMEGGMEKVAKWSDIFNAYQIDPYLGSLRLMPKITDAHVNPEKIHKMKVSKCTQVFSHSVAAAINVFAFSGTTVTTEQGTVKLDKSATDTASLIQFLDELFDSLNGSSFHSNPGKKFRVAVTKNSPHPIFWKEAIVKLKTFKFMKNGSSFIPPSLVNIIKTINNFDHLWKELQNLGFTYLMPRTFNQDPLENFFGRVRQRGQRNVNPTPTDFSNYYKSLMVNNLTSSQSVGANCEDDKSEMFLTLQRLVSQGLPEEEDNEGLEECQQIPAHLSASLKPIETQALKYVSGYLLRSIGKQPCNCTDLFLKKSGVEDNAWEEFLRAKEYVKGKQTLNYVSLEFLEKLKYALAVIKYIFNRNLNKTNLVHYTLQVLLKTLTLTPCLHDTKIKTDIFKYFIKLKLFNYTTQLNRIIKGLDRRPIPNNAPKFFLSAKKIHSNLSKLKKK